MKAVLFLIFYLLRSSLCEAQIEITKENCICGFETLERVKELNKDSVKILDLCVSVADKDENHRKLSSDSINSILKMFPRIEEIYICAISFVIIPKNVFNLSALNTLQLNSCSISKIPKKINKLRHLKILNLESNPIIKVPGAIKKIETLKSLYLSGESGITNISSVFEIKSLQLLSLCDFRKISIPETIINLKYLNYLDLRENDSILFPNDFENLVQLKSLNLSNSIYDRNYLKGKLKNCEITY